MDACPGPASPQTFHTDVPNDGCPECGPAAVGRGELTQRCGHECLKQPDHDGPHFYGYIGGPYSYEGLLRRVDELEAERTAVIDAINLYGDDVLHDALDAIGFAPRARAYIE